MNKEMDSAQILRHLEEDMGDLLGLFNRENVYEIMLNPYKREDGLYEGHIWYEHAKLGMVRLTQNNTIHLARYSEPKIGDRVFYRYVEEGDLYNVINYHVLPSASGKEQLEVIGMVLKNSIAIDDSGEYYLEQDEHYKLNILANNIAERAIYSFRQPIAQSELEDVTKLSNKINEHLEQLIGIVFKVGITTINSQEDLQKFNKQPKSAITKTFVKMSASKAEQIMGILAAANAVHFHSKEPRLECVIPFYNHRFTGQLQPMVKFPSFTIRKHSSHVIPLDEYVASGMMPDYCAETIRDWIRRGYNILIAGGVGSGKTTLLNALIYELAKIHPQVLNRVGIIEDTSEIQNPVENAFEFVKTNEVNLDDCLKTALRSRPNSIMLGEIRGKEAYTLFKAMLTGQKNCMGTIHASGTKECTFRFEQCIKEHPDCRDMPVQRDQIANALNAVISIQRTTVRVITPDGKVENIVKRKITGLREIKGFDPKHNIYEDIMFYQDKEAVLEKTEPTYNSFTKYQ